jgi:hypothetical protein
MTALMAAGPGPALVIAIPTISFLDVEIDVRLGGYERLLASEAIAGPRTPQRQAR